MADQDWRLIELGQYRGDKFCIALGANHVSRRRGCSKAWKIRGKSRDTRQAVLEIGSTPTPPMKSKNTWRSRAEHLGKHCAVNERP